MLKQIKILFVLFAGLTYAAAGQNTFPSSGDVGIGTTSPQFPLDVSGQARLQTTANFDLGSLGSDNTIYLRSSHYEAVNSLGGSGLTNVDDTTNGASLGYVVEFSAGWAGISTLNRTTGFGPGDYDVYVRMRSDGTGSSPNWLVAGIYDGTIATYPLNGSLSPSTSYQELYLGRFTLTAAALGDSIQTYFSLSGVTSNYFVDYVKFVKAPLFTGSNVGIGTTSPGSKLEVDGSITLTSGSGASMKYADGTTQSTAWTGTLTGGDYAESVDITGDRGEYEPGDVLVVDSAHPGHFLKTTEPYSLAVTGVYSTKPGVVGRRQKIDKALATTEVPMAMVGIVPTKVSSENGPIKPGDVLVTSSKAGYAMKGTDRSLLAGAVIGKALGSLDLGTGVIEAVISLQ